MKQKHAMKPLRTASRAAAAMRTAAARGARQAAPSAQRSMRTRPARGPREPAPRPADARVRARRMRTNGTLKRSAEEGRTSSGSASTSSLRAATAPRRLRRKGQPADVAPSAPTPRLAPLGLLARLLPARCSSAHRSFMRGADASARTASFTHSCARPASTTVRTSSAKGVRRSSPTTCASCECVRLQKMIYAHQTRSKGQQSPSYEQPRASLSAPAAVRTRLAPRPAGRRPGARRGAGGPGRRRCRTTSRRRCRPPGAACAPLRRRRPRHRSPSRPAETHRPRRQRRLQQAEAPQGAAGPAGAARERRDTVSRCGKRAVERWRERSNAPRKRPWCPAGRRLCARARGAPCAPWRRARLRRAPSRGCGREASPALRKQEARQAPRNRARCAQRQAQGGLCGSCDAVRCAIARRGAGARTVVVDRRRQFWLRGRRLRVAQPRQRGAQQAERLALRGRRALSARLARGVAFARKQALAATHRSRRRLEDPHAAGVQRGVDVAHQVLLDAIRRKRKRRKLFA